VVQVEVRAGAQQSQQLKARMNAMLALQEALGELQRTTGPDQRVTATGGLWDDPQAGTEHLVGVWSAVDANDDDRGDGAFVRWLVSRTDQANAEQLNMVNNAQPITFVANGDDSYYSAPDTHAVLVGAGSAFPTDPNNPDEPMRGGGGREARGA
jgi:hypothetical protein